jgi:Lipocalin-like domain
MKKSLFRAVFFTAIACLSMVGCKKFEKVEPDAKKIIVGKVWKIVSRVENDGSPSLPDCAKDDILELKSNGTFNSLIGGTQCNPSETDVIGGNYKFSENKKTITFIVPGFEYTGKVISASTNQVVIEFYLGPDFIIRDTFKPKY